MSEGRLAATCGDGLLVHTVEQAVDAVDRIGRLDRAGCRDRARKRFDADRMVADYLTVYEEQLSRR